MGRRAMQAGEVTTSERGAEATPIRVVLVTGMSGAGKSSALKALEDIGYEALDNLPLSLLSGLLPFGLGPGRPMAIGIDIRTRDFHVDTLLAQLSSLQSRPEIAVRFLFLDCDDEILGRRFTATRRRHPLALDRPIADGIAQERALISPLRQRADIVIDTTNLTLGALRSALNGHFGFEAQSSFLVTVMSFSYGYGLPREADIVFDVRFLSNPHYVESMSKLTGTDSEVAAHIEADSDFASFFDRLTALIGPLLPRYDLEGKSYLTIAIGCTGGRHRSVFVAERLAAWLANQGQRVSLRHRDVDRSELR
ncbi:MAG: RNase adapter RapZ [Alphaproteobacteria bacterium]